MAHTTPGRTTTLLAEAAAVIGVVGLFFLAPVSTSLAVMGGGVFGAGLLVFLVMRHTEKTPEVAPTPATRQVSSTARPTPRASARPSTATSTRSAGATSDSAAASASDLVTRWDTATPGHDDVLERYAAWELDPEMLLRFPALWDLSLQVNQDFHNAMERATQLRTTTVPGGPSTPHTKAIDDYDTAVNTLTRTWKIAEQNARRTGLDNLSDQLRGDADRALKLIRHADQAATRQEEASYLDQATTLLHRLSDRGIIPPHTRVEVAIEERSVRALESGQ